MENDISKELKNLQEMEIQSNAAKDVIKIPILSTRVSNRATIVLAIVPILFITGVIFAEYLKLDWKLFTGFYEWVVNLDQEYGDSSVLNWILRFLILGGPAVIVFINLLSVLHVYFNRPQKEIIFTIKLKWFSILIVLFGCAFFLYFFGYLIVENL